MSVSFSLGGVTATVQNPDLNDQLNLDPHQVVQPKASGGFYRFALADATDTLRELKWSNLRLSELNALQTFFNNQAQGTLNEFTFTDERGVSWAAYFLNATLDPITVADEAASIGSFVTGGETVPTTVRSGGFYQLTIKLHIRSGSPSTSAATESPTSTPTEAGTPGPTAAPTSPPKYALESALVAHENLTTTAHGGIVASTDSRLTNARTPTAHASTHASGGSDPVSPASIGADAAGAAAAAQAAAEAASIPLTALVTSVGSPGSNSNVPSEAAVRTALTSAISTAESAAEAASDAYGAAATVQTNLNAHAALTTTAHGGIVAPPSSPTAGHFASLTSTGQIQDSDDSASSFDAAGAASTVQSALNTHAALTTTAHGGLIPASAAGADGGVATLDVNGKVPTSQLPTAILGALEYQGTWDCSGGSYPSSPAKGQYWVCSVAGTISGTAYGVGDWLTYNGASWNRVDGQQVVSSVCGKVGAVTLGPSDVGADASGTAAAAQAAAEAASIPLTSLVTSVGSPGSNSNVPSEAAVRTALTSAISAAETAAEAASDASGSAAAVQTNLNTHTALTTTAHGGIVAAPSSTTSGHAATFSGTTGQIQDAGAAPELVPSSFTSGHLASFTSAGQLQDSGDSISSFDASGAANTVQTNLNTHAGLTTTAHGGLVAPPSSPTAGDFASLTSAGQIQDSGKSASSFIAASALVTSVGSPGSNSNVPSEEAVRTAINNATSGLGEGNVEGPGSSTAGDFAAFSDTTGKNLEDSGKSASSFDASGAANTVQTNLNTHAGLTTTAHGGIVAAPSSTTNNDFVSFNGTSGQIQDSGKSASSFDASGAANTVQTNLNTHAGLTTTAHGGIVASLSSPTAGDFASLTSAGQIQDSGKSSASFAAAQHETNHLHGGSDVLALPDAVEFVFCGSGSALTTSADPICLYIPFACTISGWAAGSPNATNGSVTFNVGTVASNGAVTSLIGSGTAPAISSAIQASSTSLTNWTTAIAAGTWIQVSLASVSTFDDVTLSLTLTRS